MYLSFPLSTFTDNSDYPFFIQFGTHKENLPPHQHKDFCELVFVLHGTAIHRVNDEAYFIKKGDVFVISSDLIHSYENPQDFQICNIMYPPERLYSFHVEVRKLPGFHALFLLEPYFRKEFHFESRLKLSLEQFSQIHTLLKKMLLEYESKQLGWRDVEDAYFNYLVILLSRIYAPTSLDFETLQVRNIATSISYLEEHFTEPISLKLLADLSHISVRHFARIFKATYHTTPNMYLLNLRLEYACTLMKQTNLTISDVALQSGFSNSTYFTRQFHTHYKITPRQYRANSLNPIL